MLAVVECVLILASRNLGLGNYMSRWFLFNLWSSGRSGLWLSKGSLSELGDGILEDWHRLMAR